MKIEQDYMHKSIITYNIIYDFIEHVYIVADILIL